MRYTSIGRFCLLSLLWMMLALQSFAQQTHFIYLQTDNQQPFYIKYNNRIYSSSSSGYLILSKLKDPVVEFAIGFPKTDQGEQKFQCSIENSDKGYLIKQFGEKGWGLYDLQSSAIVYTATVKSNPSTVVNGTTAPVTDDPFANMLSKVTQDSTVKNVTVRKEEKPVPELVKPPVVTPPVVVTVPVTVPVQKNPEPKKEEPVVVAPIIVPVKDTPVTEPVWVAPAKSTVQQLRKFESREGADFVYEVVGLDGSKDTVRLFIAKDTVAVIPTPVVITEQKTDSIPVITEEKKPVSTEPVVNTTEIKPVVVEPVKTEEKKEPIKEEAKIEEPKKEEPKKEEVKIEEPKKEEPKKEETKPIVQSVPNSTCAAVATEDDFMKLRKKMAAESKDEAMITVAKKYFKTKCFSTAQIKNLAVLFLNDEGRYRFYDAAMPFITDFANFKSLGDTIQDEYYKKRFIALLPNQ